MAKNKNVNVWSVAYTLTDNLPHNIALDADDVAVMVRVVVLEHIGITVNNVRVKLVRGGPPRHHLRTKQRKKK